MGCFTALKVMSSTCSTWTIWAVSKTVVGLVPTVGSNPTLSAEAIR